MTVPSRTPGSWLSSRDEAFFRIVTPLFPRDMLFATGVLLASYDGDDEQAAEGAPDAVRLPRQPVRTT